MSKVRSAVQPEAPGPCWGPPAAALITDDKSNYEDAADAAAEMNEHLDEQLS